MGGHSKWSTIKRAKALTDAKRSKVWTKVIREVTVAARIGGKDEDTNPRLRQAILAAKAVNMPKENIERGVKKGVGGLVDGDYKELVYEGYGPGGVAIVIECMTDNNNRTASDVRSTLTKNNGTLGAPGSVNRLFKKHGRIVFTVTGDASTFEEKLMEVGLENGLDDLEYEGEEIVITCDPFKMQKLRDAYDAAGVQPDSAEVVMTPETTVAVAGDNARRLLKMIDILENFDDVQNVWTNMEIDDDELESILSA